MRYLVNEGVERLAQVLYMGQVDKAGDPMWLHAKRVADSVGFFNREVYQAALLHDVIEDGLASAEQLLEEDVDPVVVRLVVVLSRPPGMPYADYIREVRDFGGDAELVKRADLDDNMDDRRLSALPPEVADRLRLKYRQARRILDRDED